MANREHLKILKQGVETWNRWRIKNPRVVLPDLSAADLRAANLTGANLSNANFTGASLDDANLMGANLSGANFISATLSDADLSSADLNHANFVNTNLGGANLGGANLHYATIVITNLGSVELARADLLNAFMGNVMMGNVDLTEVRNLESIYHLGPSSIGIDTIYKSHGNIPEKFLRGCGVPEEIITYMRSLVGKAIEFYSCFISYSSKDDEFANRLYADLQNEGVRCWFAPEELKIGDRFRVKIDESIRLYDKLLLVLSENSVASDWVKDEVESALEKEREQNKTVLFPVRLDGAVIEVKSGWPAAVRRDRHIGDFSEWKNHDSYRKAFERLMRDLKAEARREAEG